MNLAPIALFAYNRPDHLRASLAALKTNPLAAQSKLYLFSDGPKNAQAEPLVASVRAVARAIDGFGSVPQVERESNLGLVASITGEVGRLCQEFGRVIVLEDDLIAAPFFLSFMNQALEKYESEPRVMQVSGYMYPIAHGNASRPVLLPMTSCWGWASWRRAWTAYDASMKGYEALKVDRARRRAFNLDGHYDYMKMLSDHAAGRVQSWGAVWHLNVFMHGGLTLYPPRSLISNIGFDGSGTHGQGDQLGRVQLGDAIADIAWPGRIETDQEAYRDTKRLIRASKKGVRHWLRNLFPA